MMCTWSALQMILEAYPHRQCEEIGEALLEHRLRLFRKPDPEPAVSYKNEYFRPAAALRR
jgi:hypothetical protein